jgi:hypothetical protein
VGGVHFKKLRRAEGGAKIFEVFRVKTMVFRFFIEGRVEGVGGGFCNPQLLNQGRIQGGEHGALPPKIGKDIIFLRKMVIFHTKYPKIFAPPSARRNFLKYAPP